MASDLVEPFRVARRSGGPAPPARRPRSRSFTRAGIAEAVRAWAELYGAPPTVSDWEPSRARRAGQEWRARRFEEGGWPSITMVRREFGTLSAAIRAAGLQPRRAPSRVRPKLTGPDEVLRAIQEWTRRYGEPPTMADWEPWRARRNGQLWRIARYRRGDWPSARTVRVHFGSFTRAVAEAGLAPRGRGQRQGRSTVRSGQNRELMEERRLAQVTGFGPGALARCTREVARARVEGDPASLRAALIELGAAALKWADQIDAAEGRGRVAA